MAAKAAAKKNPLAAALDRAEEGGAEETPEPTTAAEPAPARTAKRARSREGTRLVGGHFPEAVSRQLAMIAAEEGVTKQELLAEALNLLFTKKGKEAIV